MSNVGELYKCDICGNVVSLEVAGPGSLVCCGENMKLLAEKGSAEEQGGEKHVPVVEGNTVKIGSIPHPMDEDHFIVFVQAVKDGKVVAEKRLFPGEAAEANFDVEFDYVREYCNLHGLWKSG